MSILRASPITGHLLKPIQSTPSPTVVMTSEDKNAKVGLDTLPHPDRRSLLKNFLQSKNVVEEYFETHQVKYMFSFLGINLFPYLPFDKEWWAKRWAEKLRALMEEK